APQRFDLRRSVEREEPSERCWVFLLEMLGTLDAQQRHEQERQKRRAQTIEGRTDVTVEFAADLKEPAIYQARESQQAAGPRNRRTFSKQRCGIIEQSEIRELPIQCPIFSVSIEAHRYRLFVVRSLSRDDRSGVPRSLARQRSNATFLFAARRPTGRYRRFRGNRDRRQRKLRTLIAPRRPHQLADGVLGDAQLVRDRPVAHALGFQDLDGAQTFRGDTPPARTPACLPTECRRSAVLLARLVAPDGCRRAADSPWHV